MVNSKPVYNTDIFSSVIANNVDLLLSQLKRLNASIGDGMLLLCVRHDTMAHTLLAFERQNQIDNIDYELAGTPCENVFDSGACSFGNDICERFPDDQMLQDIQAKGYIGVSIKNEANENIGILVSILFGDDICLQQNKKTVELYADYLSTFVQKCHLENTTTAHLNFLNEVEMVSQTGVWEYNVQDDQLFWSDEVYRIHDLPLDTQVDINRAIGFYTEEDRESLNTLVEKAIAHGHSYKAEFEIVSHKGVKKWVKTTGRPSVDADGRIQRLYGAIEDISQERALMSLSQERAVRIESILDNINDAVITIDSKGFITHCNNVALSLFGYEEDELENVNISSLMPEPYSTQHDEHLAKYAKTGQTHIIGVGRQLPALKKNGEIFQMELSVTQSSNLGQTQYIGVIRDISDRLEAENTIYNLAFTDNVTQLRNSQWFEKECQDFMLEASVESHCMHVLLIDIDSMSKINFKHGYSKGDAFLREVANNLKKVIGEDYRLYKHNGDTFIVLSTQTYAPSDLSKFENNAIESAILNPENFHFELETGVIGLSASLASVVIDTSKQGFESMLDILYYTLQIAKRSAPFGLIKVNRDGINEYDRYIAIQHELESVIDSGELSLAMQPQYNQKKEICSFEALVRWYSKDLGWVSPAEFIPMAEQSQAIFNIGKWVLVEACKAAQEVLALGMKTPIAINISPKQLVANNFAETLVNMLDHMQIPTSMLVIEITETALITDIELVKSVMHHLHDKGIVFSIDDFGTGYSSLAYLHTLPINEIKIDKSFVDEIVSNQNGKSHSIVDAIIDMSNALGATNVAEGVESDAQYQYLKQKGCELFQGYLLSKPVNMDMWRKMLRTERFASAKL